MLVNDMRAVEDFEDEMARYCGAPYAVAVDTCTAALFLCCVYLKQHSAYAGPVTIPNRTFPGVANSVLHAGWRLAFADKPWAGLYELGPLGIYDAALRLRRGMFAELLPGVRPQTYCCLSFQYRKHLPIGRGGMVLTDDAEAVNWLELARFFGRHAKPLLEDQPEFVGWHMYMEPERAARGLTLLARLPDDNPDLRCAYPDLSTFEVYR